MWFISQHFGFVAASVCFAVIAVCWALACRRWQQYPAQKFRYRFLAASQIILFFIIPEIVFRFLLTVKQITGSESWRAYGLFIPFPLFVDGLAWPSHSFYFYGSVAISFLIMPLAVFLTGKKYCSYLCPFGCVSETIGDRFREPGRAGRQASGRVAWLDRLRWFRIVFLIAAIYLVVAYLHGGFSRPGSNGIPPWFRWYALALYTAAGLGLLLLPIAGSRVFCRGYCPLASVMEWLGSRFSLPAIVSADKASCGDCVICDRHCQMGIPVSRLIREQGEISLANSTCVQCGICVAVCPQQQLRLVQSFADSARPCRVSEENDAQ